MVIPKSLLLPLIIFISILSIARFTDPPDGNTGAPGEGICTSCHNPGNPNGYMGSVSISGLPAQTMAGQVYPLTVIVSNPDLTAVRGGFQMVALDENNQNAGTFNNPGPSSKVSISGGRRYHEHNPGKNFSGNAQISWTVNWTAPMVQGNEQVTFYASGLIANGNNNTFGDLVVATDQTTIVEGSAPPLTVSIINKTDPQCFGQNSGSATASASGGVPPYDFSWTTGGNQATENNMPAGTHMVTVFDQSGSSAQEIVTLIAPPPLSTTLSIINTISCPGGQDGILEASANGGTAPYNFLWSNGQVGSRISNLSSGPYAVTIEDANGCLEFQNTFLSQPDPITFDVITEPVKCWGETTGVGEILNVQGGNQGGFAFSWSDGFNEQGLQSRRSNLKAGNYFVTISDQNNCSATTSLIIETPDSMVLSTIVGQIRCRGENNGTIELNMAGGTMPYVSLWEDGNMSPRRDSLSPGIYGVVISDQNGCSIEDSIELIDPDSLVLTLDTLINSQCGDSSGFLQVILSGGYGAYKYLWSNGDTSAIADSLIPGSYFISVLDSLDCLLVDSFEIVIDDRVGPQIMSQNITVFLDSSGLYELSPDDLNYSVRDACSDSIQVSFDLPVISCNNLNDTLIGRIEAIDELGNISTDSFRIYIQDTIAPIFETKPQDVIETTCDGIFWHDPVISGNDNCDQIQLKQVKGPILPDSLGIGIHNFEVELVDISGNSVSHSWTVEVRASNITGELVVTDPSCFGGRNGSVSFITSNPDLIVNLAIEPNADPDSLFAGEYQLIVTDTIGCLARYNFEVKDPEQIFVSDTIIKQASGAQINDGLISLVPGGGTGPYTLSWYDGDPLSGGNLIGSNTNEIKDLLPGDYYLVISDIYGCSETFVFTVGTATNIHSANQSLLTVFPNPTGGMLHIKGDQEVYRVYLNKLDGSMMPVQFDVSNRTMDISDLAPGAYHLILILKNGSSQSVTIQLIN